MHWIKGYNQHVGTPVHHLRYSNKNPVIFKNVNHVNISFKTHKLITLLIMARNMISMAVAKVPGEQSRSKAKTELEQKAL